MQHTSGRLAGLDGLRGLAMAMVLVFHFWPRLLPGGFLGVSLFFTLSGFLIARLLLAEIEQSGRVDYRRFLRRRIRRLLPAALATLGLVVVVWSLSGRLTETLTREAVGSALNVANWQRIASGEAYGSSPESSPILHFWSLAIEEQVYLVLPLLVIACRRRKAAAWVLTGLAVASASYTLSLDGDATIAYYSTFSRAGEMFVGAAAAAWLPARLRTRSRTGSAAAAAGLLVLLVSGALVSLGTEAVYRGGLFLCALCSVLVVVGVLHSPAFGHVLDVQPLRWLGRTSYGMYLLHWPVLVYLRDTSLDDRVVPFVALAATVGLAALSRYRFEEPVLRGALPSWRLAGVLGLLFGLLFGSTAWAAPSGGVDYAAAQERLDALVASGGSAEQQGFPYAADNERDIAGANAPVATGGALAAASGSDPIGAPVRPARVGVFGDSKALTLGLGLEGPDMVLGTSFSAMGCPLGRFVTRRESSDSPPVRYAAECDWSRRIPEEAAEAPPLDVALVWYGTWDVRDVQVDGIPGWVSVEDDAYRNWLRKEMEALTGLIAAETGATRVVWLTVYPDPVFDRVERFAVYNDTVVEFAASHEVAEVADLAGWLESTGEVSRLLPDFIHPSFDAAGEYGNTSGEIARRFLDAVVTRPTR